MSLVCLDLPILRFTKVLGVMVPFCCSAKNCHRYLLHSLTHDFLSLCLQNLPLPLLQATGLMGRYMYTRIAFQMHSCILIHECNTSTINKTTVGLAQSVERMNAER